MEKKWVFLGISVVIAIVIFIGLIGFSGVRESPSSGGGNLEECETLEYNGEDKIDLVFFSDEGKAKKYSEYLLKTSPFDEKREEFNVFYIDDYEPACELYKGIALLCYSKDLVKKAGSCPNDFIFVLEEDDKSVRSSSYMNVMSINERHPLNVLPHEFGHAFVNLAEEYVPASLPRGAENCVSECSDFEGEECFEGCSLGEYKRSIDSGVMRTLNSRDYGEFNEELIRAKIGKSSVGITGRAVLDGQDCSSESYYLIEGKWLVGNSIEVLDRSLEVGCVGDSGSGAFSYNIILDSGEVLDGGEFNPEILFTDVQGGSTLQGETFLGSANFFLKVPVIPGGETLEIGDNFGGEKTEVNLADIGGRPCRK